MHNKGTSRASAGRVFRGSAQKRFIASLRCATYAPTPPSASKFAEFTGQFAQISKLAQIAEAA